MAVSRHLGSEGVWVLDKSRKELPALFGVMCVALGMTLSLLSSSFQMSSPSLAPATNTITHVPPSDEYALAYRESFGLFDDIPEKSWKRMQHHARNYVQYYDSSKPTLHIDKPVQWFIENQEPNFSCPHVRRVGANNGHGDGPKWVCNPHRIGLREPPRAKDCLIYSIGSNGEYDFEEGLLQEIGLSKGTSQVSCEIHVFDFGGYERPEDAARNIHYHKWGLQGVGASDSNSKRVMKSFPDILKTLGHENRTIDILKIDCEGCEKGTFKDWIDHDIRQIQIEVHGAKASRTPQLFDSFPQHNYVMFSKEPNSAIGGRCIEFSYLKLHPSFFGR